MSAAEGTRSLEKSKLQVFFRKPTWSATALIVCAPAFSDGCQLCRVNGEELTKFNTRGRLLANAGTVLRGITHNVISDYDCRFSMRGDCGCLGRAV